MSNGLAHSARTDGPRVVVATEIDFDSTLVACTRVCGAALLGSDLEMIEVSAETRLDIDGDTVNVKMTQVLR